MTTPAPPTAPISHPYDVEAVRAAYPALAEGIAHFDGPGGSQVPATVAAAVAASMASAVSNRHGPFRSSRRADATVAAARAALADLTGGQPEGVVVGPSMTALTYVLAGALAKTWRPGDEVVVSRLDHDANVRPWLQAAARAGATVRWAEVDTATCELPTGQYDDLLSERTRLVAVTAASNACGTRPDVAGIVERAHAVGALAYVDGVHATPHLPVDVRALGADCYALSTYKFGGPHLGAVVADPQLLGTLWPDKLAASTDDVPDRFELGTLPFEALAGVTAAVEHLAGLVPGPGTRRERLLRSMAVVGEHELACFDRLLADLDRLPHVHPVGAPALRTPTLMLTVDGHTPRAVAERLAERDVAVWDGHYYALELLGALGLLEGGGAVRVGIAPYTSDGDVDRLVDALAGLAAGG